MNLQLEKNIIISGKIIAETGIHIGGNKETLQIGGVDSPVIKDPKTGLPLIPGSSLKGKMRNLIELAEGNYDEVKENGELVGYPHSHKNKCTDPNCPVCVVFGSTKNPNAQLTRLIVRDSISLNVDELDTEIKTENVIDRVQGKAFSPRQIERVPAQTEFSLELVYSIYGQNNDKENLNTVFKALNLVEDSYLGGSGSRGYGKVKFVITSLAIKTIDDYTNDPTGKELLKSEEEFSPAEIMNSAEYKQLFR